MSSIAELIRRADRRLRRQLDVDAGLRQIAARAQEEKMPRLLAARRRALEEALLRLDRLAGAVEHLSAVRPFLAEGWPEERDRLRGALATDLPTGLGEWLGYWLTAASRRRTEAMDRLEAEVPLPAAASVLAHRISVANRALATGDWNLCHDLLELGHRGLRIGSWTGPEDGVREDLRLLAARLALRNGLLDEAGAVIGEGAGEPDSAAWLALRSRYARACGQAEVAEALLQRARELDPRDLDATAEAIALARDIGDPGLALDDARAAAEAFLSLSDVEGDVNRLVDVPCELYIALAEWARDEDDRDRALSLLDHAATVAPPGDEIIAMVEEVRAGLLSSPAERRAALLAAGEWRAGKGHLELARHDFESALEPDPQDEEDVRTRAVAQLRLADVVAVTARQRPRRDVRESLSGALSALLAAQRQADVTGSEWWSYATESDLRAQLAEMPGAHRHAGQWGALLAAARALALNPLSAQVWLLLAQTSRTRCLPWTCEAAAARGYAIVRDPSTTAAYADALVHVGRYEQALALLDGATDDWSRCMIGRISLELGRPEEAVRYLAAGAIDPTWTWAWTSYVDALIVTGDLEGARACSRRHLDASADRLGERDELEAAAHDARVRGRPREALRIACLLRDRDLPGEISGLKEMGAALLLNGDPAGWDMFAAVLAIGPRPVTAGSWERRLRPVLSALAAAQGVELDFTRMDAPLEHARTGTGAGDPAAELRQASCAPGAPDVARPAARLTEAVLRATAVPGQGRPGDLDELLHRLAAEDGLRAEAESLRGHAAGEPAHADGAGDVPAPAPPAVRLLLPVSWFAGYDDPLHRHPLFTRCLPELRPRADRPVPAVRVETEESLEPGGYLVLSEDRLLASGHVDPGLRYCDQETLALLPRQARADPRTVLTEHGWGVPAEIVAGAYGPAELLTRSACEVVALRYGEVVGAEPPGPGPR
ncbi:hypothetical protein GCM10009733_107980 [Nonomuraea maheshkhaliensis]|uniref:Tetratricopeptide repeat protein n=1 Tax=Nonomuraea maheshkhaliensis TaxID=419590 RepID=A0ABN2HWA5_9ACTN